MNKREDIILTQAMQLAGKELQGICNIEEGVSPMRMVLKAFSLAMDFLMRKEADDSDKTGESYGPWYRLYCSHVVASALLREIFVSMGYCDYDDEFSPVNKYAQVFIPYATSAIAMNAMSDIRSSIDASGDNHFFGIEDSSVILDLLFKSKS